MEADGANMHRYNSYYICAIPYYCSQGQCDSHALTNTNTQYTLYITSYINP